MKRPRVPWLIVGMVVGILLGELVAPAIAVVGRSDTWFLIGGAFVGLAVGVAANHLARRTRG